MRYADRVRESTLSASAAVIALAGAAAGYRSFASALVVGDKNIPVCVVDSAGNWEVGVYTLTDAQTLTRQRIESSSNNGAAVAFVAGPKDVFCTPTAAAMKNGSPTVNVKAFGARGDGRAVTDAATAGRAGAGALVVTSATAGFTQADVGKVFGIFNTVITGNFPIMSGVIASVQSATQFTGTVPNTVAAIASGGALVVASDDSAALQAAYDYATANGGGEVFHPKGIYGVSTPLVAGEGVCIVGEGKQQGRPNRFPAKGTALVGLPTSYTAAPMVHLSGRGGQVRDISIDAANRFDYAVRITDTSCKAVNCAIGRGAVITHLVDAGSSTLTECDVYGAFKGTTIQCTGDALIGPNNYIFGAGDNLPNVYANGPFDDAMIFGNHFYKGGWAVPLNTVRGPNIRWVQFDGVATSGGVIGHNVFDTAAGNHIEIEVFNTGANSAIKALTINANQFYQPQPITDNTYSCIKITAGTNGAFVADIRALNISNNVGKCGEVGMAQNYKSFIEWSVGTNSRITGDVVLGNTIDGCNQVYTGTARTPAVTGTNVATPHASTAFVVA